MVTDVYIFSLENKFISFETIMTARVFRKIFAIADPASNILQSEKIDLLIEVRLVETEEGQLHQLQSDFTKVLAETKEYCSRHNLVQQDFPSCEGELHYNIEIYERK